MTREEALKTWLPVIKMGVESMPECSEALDMAIEALEQESSENAIKYFNIINELSETLGVSYDFVDEKIKEIMKALPKEPCEIGKAERSMDADVLNEIREEIVHLHDWAFSREEILRIIDKYKSESEAVE